MRPLVLILLASLLLAGCNRSEFETPQIQGHAGLVHVDQDRALWVLQKQEEIRYVSVGTGGRNRNSGWRRDTLYHFDVIAFDPATVQPRWRKRLVTYRDEQVKPNQTASSRVIGSAVTGRLLGQQDGRVWLLVDTDPYALDAATGEVLLDLDALLARQPGLADLLPSDARLWTFDRAPVVTLADGRTVRLAGDAYAPEDYVPAPPSAPAEELKPNGMPRIVPLRFGAPVVREVVVDENTWWTLWSAKEAEDALQDTFGDHARYPYSITDEGQMARRLFHRVTLAPKQSFDEVFPHVAAAEPVPGSPVLLRGRFVRDPFSGLAMRAGEGDLLAWSLSRVDTAGRVTLHRFGPGFEERWRAELPFSDNSHVSPPLFWPVDGRLLIMGQRLSMVEHRQVTEPTLASVSLEDGRFQAWNLAQEQAEAVP